MAWQALQGFPSQCTTEWYHTTGLVAQWCLLGLPLGGKEPPSMTSNTLALSRDRQSVQNTYILS